MFTPSLPSSHSDDAIAVALGHEFVIFANIGYHSRVSVHQKKPIFICDHSNAENNLLCDATELTQLYTLWTTDGLKRIQSPVSPDNTYDYSAYHLRLYNIGAERYFSPHYGSGLVRTVEDSAKADFWTFEYHGVGGRENNSSPVVIIHPSDRYDEALCIKNEGEGFYYKTGLGDEMPTEDIASLEENCQFPMFGIGKLFSRIDGNGNDGEEEIS